ncbi:MAG TPA: hypothetical protein VNJ31_11660 [Methyloceanibacter sp.]|nr:hypothetical protein [Methyloceanibacter sp.]
MPRVEERQTMKKGVVVALVLTFGLAAPTLAATKYYVTVDTVGNCSVIEGTPSAGQTPILQTSGYDSEDAADKALAEVRNDTSKCKGVVE